MPSSGGPGPFGWTTSSPSSPKCNRCASLAFRSRRGAGFDGGFDRSFRGQDNNLLGAVDPGGVYLSLARRFGGSPVPGC